MGKTVKTHACGRCNETRDASEFYWKPDGTPRHWCKPCRRAYSASRRDGSTTPTGDRAPRVRKSRVRDVESRVRDGAPVFDLDGRSVPKGTPVRVSAAPRPTLPDETDPAFSGTLCAVEYRDGAAHTVEVWTDYGMRCVYAARVSPAE